MTIPEHHHNDDEETAAIYSSPEKGCDGDNTIINDNNKDGEQQQV
jgi:hypothetical protein